MSSIEDLKVKACKEMDSRRDEIIGVAKIIYGNPETGFREVKTSRLVAEKFAEMGIPYRDGIAITGVKGILNGGSAGPTIGVLGELDSVINFDHPDADPQTGAVHACAHNAQIGMLIGIAAGLTGSGIMSSLCGRVAFMAVPAEEPIELDYRKKLITDGKLSMYEGKTELIKLGEFDDIDMVMSTHNHSFAHWKKIVLQWPTNGMISKHIRFIGKTAHAGEPQQGINALNAALIALSAINAQRETFHDEDMVRVHTIITKGGDITNSVPADIRLETGITGKTLEAIKETDKKVDRALRAGALAMGAKVRITTRHGSLPLIFNPYMEELWTHNIVTLVDEPVQKSGGHGGGSTDLGDVSQILPVLHPLIGGATGTVHCSDFQITDYQLAVLTAAKAMAMTIIDLLADGAAKGKEVIINNKPRLTKQEWLNFSESMTREEAYPG